MAQHLIGIDLGGTKILTARCDLEGHVEAQARDLTPQGLERVIDRMTDLVDRVLQGTHPADLAGVGVGAPGPLEPKSGVLFGAANLPGWNRVPLRDILTARLESRLGRAVRVVVANDANAAALGELRFGAGRRYPGVHDLVYITISTGIGGGVIADGRVFAGANGMAGEIGHMTVDLNGPLCKCGNVGCVEAIAAGPAIARAGAALVAAGRAHRLAQLAHGDPERVTTALVEAAARSGDPDARAVVAEAGRALGAAVVNVLHLYNPQLVVIGGGVAKMGDLLLDPIRAAVAAHAIPAIRRDVPIVPAALGDLVGVLGAAALVLQD